MLPMPDVRLGTGTHHWRLRVILPAGSDASPSKGLPANIKDLGRALEDRSRATARVRNRGACSLAEQASDQV